MAVITNNIKTFLRRMNCPWEPEYILHLDFYKLSGYISNQTDIFKLFWDEVAQKKTHIPFRKTIKVHHRQQQTLKAIMRGK